MLFKPNFCCNCGAKIDRAEWGILTSRRFCQACEVEHQKHDWLPRAVVGLGVLCGVFGLGVYMGSPGQPQPAALTAAQNEPARKLAVGAKQQTGIKEEGQTLAPAQQNPSATAVGLPTGPAGSEAAKEQPRTSGVAADGQVYHCGAMTKKGKPCSRRVKTKGRCWQHAGQPSALVSQSAPDVY